MQHCLGSLRRDAASLRVFVVLPLAGALCAQAASLTLEECIRRALAHHPRVAVASADLRVSRSLSAQADVARFEPQAELTQMFGPSPAANGSPYDATLRSDLTDLSAFTRTEAALVMPVYTFGKLAGKAEAARRGVAAAQHAQDQSAAEIRRDTRKAYYGILLARELKQLAGESLERIAKARARVREWIEEEALSPSDQYRFEIVSLEIEARRAAAAAAEASLLEAMKAAIGWPPSAAFDIAGERLERAEGARVNQDESAAAALEMRPEVRQLRAGVEARSALVRAARADFYPQFFLGAQLRHGYAPNRSDQKNPFVRDDFNLLQGGVAIGFRYAFSFSGARARVEQASAERDRLAAQQRLVESAVGVQARSAAQSAQAAILTLDIREKAARAARAWLAAAESTFNLGVGEPRDLADAFQAYLQTRAALLQALYDDHAARAELDFAEGRQ
ncbi:MAG: TolC family protein [Acidobacteriia bacterium]|nr:TolC family protein [Terriglobia bacterium]